MSPRPHMLASAWMAVLIAVGAPSAHAIDGERSWSKRLGGPGHDGQGVVASDPWGNVLLAGYSDSASIDLGGGPLPGDGNDIVLAKYSPSGAHLWSRRFDGTGSPFGSASSYASGIASDSTGNIIVTGYTFGSSIDMGGGPLSGRRDDHFGDIVLAKYSPSGSHVWSKRFVGSWGNDLALDVDTDPSGNVLLAGYTASGTIDLGGGDLEGGVFFLDIVLAKYSPSGSHLWSKRLSGQDRCGGEGCSDVGTSVASDPSSNVVLGGYTEAPTIDLGGGALEGRGFHDLLMAKYSPSGEHIWSKRLGGADDDDVARVATDREGNVLVAGRSLGPVIDMGGEPLAGGGGYHDIALAKYSASGRHLWSRVVGSADTREFPFAVATDPAGNVLLSGMWDSHVAFVIDALSGSGGGSDALVAKYAPDGSQTWVRCFGGDGADWAVSIASDPAGDVVVAGTTSSSSLEVDDEAHGSSGFNDLFLAKLSAEQRETPDPTGGRGPGAPLALCRTAVP